MPIAFINRSISNFRPADELAAVNAHHAHIRHERRHRGIKDAARRRNGRILSYVDQKNDQSMDDTFSYHNSLRLARQIGGLRSDPFWTLPVANTHDAMPAFDHLFNVMCPLALGLGNYNTVQHAIMRVNMLETAMYCSSMIAFDLIMQSLHVDHTRRLSQAALWHVNFAVRALGQMVADPVRGTSDIVLATIFPVAVVYVSSSLIRGGSD